MAARCNGNRTGSARQLGLHSWPHRLVGHLQIDDRVDADTGRQPARHGAGLVITMVCGRGRIRNAKREIVMSHFDTRRQMTPPVGLPREFLGSEVRSPKNRAVMDEALKWLELDDMLLPATQDRENYYGDRHLEYWLSGYVTTKEVERAHPALLKADGIRVLDFGGATGRVSRHITLMNPTAQVYISDLNINWIDWVSNYFNRPIRTIHNSPLPKLPIDNDFFDVIMGFSVFTHIDEDEIPWLLELRRVLKPGGTLFLTVLDDAVWESLRNPGWRWLKESLMRGHYNNEFLKGIEDGGIINGRYVIKYSDLEAYNVNIFLSRDWLAKKWRPHFADMTMDFTRPGDIQSTVVLHK